MEDWGSGMSARPQSGAKRGENKARGTQREKADRGWRVRRIQLATGEGLVDDDERRTG